MVATVSFGPPDAGSFPGAVPGPHSQMSRARRADDSGVPCFHSCPGLRVPAAAPGMTARHEPTPQAGCWGGDRAEQDPVPHTRCPCCIGTAAATVARSRQLRDRILRGPTAPLGAPRARGTTARAWARPPDLLSRTPPAVRLCRAVKQVWRVLVARGQGRRDWVATAVSAGWFARWAGTPAPPVAACVWRLTVAA